jgi:protein-disulfide isomerase
VNKPQLQRSPAQSSNSLPEPLAVAPHLKERSMSDLLSKALTALTTRKGAMIAAPLAVAVAGLIAIGGKNAGLVDAGKVAAPSPVAAATAASTAFSSDQRQAIEAIVKDVLVRNPEILVAASQELEKRQAAQQAETAQKTIIERKSDIFRAKADFALGDPKSDVTIVEFSDYNCGWCKKAVDEVSKLNKADPKVRIVMKEFPIFGENSQFAAKAAMASIKQGKYWEYHVALMKERQVTKDNALKIAEKVGLDVKKLEADMTDPAIEAALKKNAEIAQALGIEGTPGFIIDTKVAPGFVPLDGLQAMVAEVRKAGCKTC